MVSLAWTRTGWTSATEVIVQTANKAEEYKGPSARLDVISILNPSQESTMAKGIIKRQKDRPQGEWNLRGRRM
ncbi:hypothetical protein R1flu_027859 [Riccia fluitans]|uniref:Uncharacterized protein n=1 Tax=Riccia fluitans TaxID=41844 RepID=A0ABD1XMV2_9MARC